MFRCADGNLKLSAEAHGRPPRLPLALQSAGQKQQPRTPGEVIPPISPQLSRNAAATDELPAEARFPYGCA